jgi:hypothetical protein
VVSFNQRAALFFLVPTISHLLFRQKIQVIDEVLKTICREARLASKQASA